MVDFNKEDWIINNRNVFELPKTESVPILAIQYEILKQIEDKNIKSISDFLNTEIDTQKTITFTKGLNIDTIFSNHLKLDINPLHTVKTPVYLIFEWLILYLFKRLADNDHFLITDVYKEKYQTLKNDWLNQNIDTDETDFINNELIKCKAIVLELQKPIYSQLVFSEVQPEPTAFKKNLNNIIDKRIKFLSEMPNLLKVKNIQPITKQKTTYNKVTRDYVYSEKELKQLKYQIESQYLETYLKNRTEDENGNYLFTYNSEIDDKINLAIKRDYNFFNEDNKNYREVYFDRFGSIEVFKIEDIEYLIESRESENHSFYVCIYNFEYAEKWLKQLNNLLGNYRFGTLKGIKEDISEDAQKKGINNIDNIAVIIENLFFHCLDFHNNQKFERVANHNIEKYELFNCINAPGGIFWWKQKKDDDVRKCINSLIMELEDLFISVSLKDFIQIRDFINLWIEKIIDITINNETKIFEWAYSPFMETVFSLNEKVTNLFSDERIKLKKSLEPHFTTSETVKPDEVKKEPKKLAEKWYALLYWIELNANGEQPPKNSEGAFIKSEIEAIRKKVTGKSGQSFYRAFIGIDLNNEKSIKLSFGKEWKKQIIELSKNNSKIIDYIQSKYTS